MKSLTGVGKYLFAIPFAIFGIMHFLNGADMAAMIPSWMPGGVIWIYVTGASLIAAAVSILMGKKDGLATFLLGIMLIIFVLTMHIPGVMNAGDNEQMAQASMSNAMKDLMLAGAAWMYSRSLAKDK